MKVKDFYKQFGKRLKQLRAQANISQEKLAEQVGVATTTVSYWENAHNPVSFSKIPVIADALNVPIYKLFMFLDVEEKLADKDYITLLQSKTGEELNTLFNVIKELQKIKK
ncbi:helix-turn-helix transcriptional regulator [bacterium]|nr:helix-turn-helix transcriptional regulator [bacterium]